MFFISLYLILALTYIYGDQKTFPTGFSKKHFHVTTLKDPNFADDEPPEKNPPKTEDCPDFSPEELKKIKLDYDNDGARVKFVSADALSVDEKEKKKTACLKKILAAAEPGEKKMKATFDSPVKFENKTEANTKNSTGRKGNRRDNEYEFDTIEYYDDADEVTFENDVCPGLVDVIDLDIAEIRKYDVECEKICEWSSLYDHGTWDENW